MTTEKPDNYQVLDHVTQILKRPDSYIGSIENGFQEEYVLSCEDKITKSKTYFNEGLVRIFIEPLCNAIDNVWRSNGTQTYIKIKILQDEITFSNDGFGIPIEKKNNTYIPEIIFGQLLSSSNYNDNAERKTSGRNGLGCKLSNIFSNQFEIKILDTDRNLQYAQSWSNNMTNKTEPVVKSHNKSKKNMVEVNMKIDLKYFKTNINEFNQLYPYLNKKVVDAAFTCSPSVKIYLNDKLIPIKNIEDYAKYYLQDIPKDKIAIKTKEYDIIILGNNNVNEHAYLVSFVNGIETPEQGVHIDAITSSIYEYYVSKNKNQKFKWNDIKKFFHIFCKFEIDKPKFNSQLKSRLTAPKIKVDIPTQKLNKFEISNVIKNYLEQKNDKNLMSSLTKSRKQKIEGLDQANKAGTKESDKCVLIITEGLSAKTFACVGIKYGCFGMKGRDYFGIYPIRGKLLNVRNANTEQIKKNREINDIMQILNINEKNSGDYGKILLLTDSDVDGNHIEGLFINFIELLCPQMLSNIYTMRTPILKISKGKNFHYFYDEYQANDYIQENNIKNAKYFKGLGSNNQNDIKDIFGKNVIKYDYDNKKDREILELAFSNKKNYSDKRKDWLSNYQRCYIDENNPLPISSFINKEFIRFSIDDCDRSLPSVVDGFKISQRKVFFGTMKKKLKYEGNTIKVAQLGALVAQLTNYHHGETNLHETIIRMTHDHVGSNNIALLAQDGMLGTRLMGGKDAASPRYIFTKLNKLTSFIFKQEDEPLLVSEIDDGDEVEPIHYVPIIPMILVNGAIGIGTGWSTNIPSYNPITIIDILLDKLKNKKCKELIPYYNGFKGTIKQISEYKYECKGICSSLNNNSYEITELPIDMWIDGFKEYLDELVINKKIKKYTNHSTTENPNFKITISNSLVLDDINKKLTSIISTTNLVCLDSNKKIKKYNNVSNIINEYYDIRLDYYERRRLHIINELIDKLCILNNKYRFLKMIIEDEIIIYKKPIKEVEKILKDKNFDVHPAEDNYNYLVELQFKHATKEQLEKLKKEIDEAKKNLDYFKNITDKEIWTDELNQLKKELN